MTTNEIPFAQRDDEEVVTFAETAEILRTAEGTLRWWRQRGEGPEFFRMGKRLYTTVGDLRTFIRQQRLAARRAGRGGARG